MKCDLHCHTSYSHDSTARPEEMVEAALRKGINCLAICDHGETKGARKAAEYAKDKPILIIPGIEIKSKQGDILGLNIKEIIPNKLPASETIERIRELGGLAAIPHPFGWSCSFKGDLENIIPERDNLGETDSSQAPLGTLAIEVLNASIFGRGNKKALAFSKNHRLPKTVGSDAHFPNFIGRVYLEIPGDNFSVEEVLDRIKKGAVTVHGREAEFFEKVIDHIKRNIAKLKSIHL